MTYSLERLPQTETPSDYLRLQFDPANVPSKRIVGLLACQRMFNSRLHSSIERLIENSVLISEIGDPLLRRLTTKITSAKPAPILAVPMQKGKGIKKKDKNGSTNGTPGGSGTTTPAVEATTEIIGKLWEVELEDTVCFPEG